MEGGRSLQQEVIDHEVREAGLEVQSAQWKSNELCIVLCSEKKC